MKSSQGKYCSYPLCEQVGVDAFAFHGVNVSVDSQKGFTGDVIQLKDLEVILGNCPLVYQRVGDGAQWSTKKFSDDTHSARLINVQSIKADPLALAQDAFEYASKYSASESLHIKLKALVESLGGKP